MDDCITDRLKLDSHISAVIIRELLYCFKIAAKSWGLRGVAIVEARLCYHEDCQKDASRLGQRLEICIWSFLIDRQVGRLS